MDGEGIREALSLRNSQVTLDSSVEALRRQAETVFGVRGRLWNAAGECLRGAMNVVEAGLRSGDLLTLQASQTRVASCRHAFVAILGDASAVSWGQRDVVHKRLFDVQQIQTNSSACAAIMTDGSVVCWGPEGSGGDCSFVRDQLLDIQHIQSTQHAFAAIRRDGVVVTWGMLTMVVILSLCNRSCKMRSNYRLRGMPSQQS